MKQAVSIAKQSKKAQKAYYAEQRGSWNGIDPVTRAIPSGKMYNRTKARQEARSLIRNGGKERATGALHLAKRSDRRCRYGHYEI